MFESLLNPIFKPLLLLQPWASITIIAFIVSVIIVIVYKFITNQDLMKRLKGEIKEFQKEAKELRSDPQKAMAVNKKAMDTNMKYMMQSMKPTLVTFIPIIIIFGWLNAHLAYEPILPDQEFSITAFFEQTYSGDATINVPDGLFLLTDQTQTVLNNQVIWTMKGDAGEYIAEISVGEYVYDKDVKIVETIVERDYALVIKKIKDGPVKTIQLSNPKVKPLGEISIFGWQPGWLAFYIILSIIFSMVLRKFLKVY